MAYVIAAPCVGVKDTACVDACPVVPKVRDFVAHKYPLTSTNGRSDSLRLRLICTRSLFK